MIISARAASDLATDAEDIGDVVHAIIRAERKEPGSWLPFDADEAAEWLGCDVILAEEIGAELAKSVETSGAVDE